MLKKLTQLTIIAFLLCSLPIPVEARSSSSSSSSSSKSSPSTSSSTSSFKSTPSTSYSRSSSTPTQTKSTTSSSSSNSSSTFGTNFNSSYSSPTVQTKPAQAVTTTKPSVTTTYMPEYRIGTTTGRTETRYVTIFSEAGNRTVPVVVPFGYTAPIILPNTYYPATTVVTDNNSPAGVIFAVFTLAFLSLMLFIVVRSFFF